MMAMMKKSPTKRITTETTADVRPNSSTVYKMITATRGEMFGLKFFASESEYHDVAVKVG